MWDGNPQFGGNPEFGAQKGSPWLASHRLLLSQDGATGGNNIFEYLPGLHDTMFAPNM